MTVIKTAVSLPAGLFERASTIADEMKIPRSRLFAMAVRDFIEKHRSKRMWERLKASHAEGLDEDERNVLEGMRRAQRSIVDKW